MTPVPWQMLVALAVGLVAGLLATAVLVRRFHHSGAFGCGRCGYHVRTATTLRCPRCNADWREVGMVRDSRPITAGWMVVGVLLGLGAMCLMFAGLAMLW